MILDREAKIVQHPLGHWHIEGIDENGVPSYRLETNGQWQLAAETAFASREDAEAAIAKYTDIVVDGWRCEFGYFYPFKDNWHVSHTAYYMYALNDKGEWVTSDKDWKLFATQQAARDFAIECSKRKSA